MFVDWTLTTAHWFPFFCLHLFVFLCRVGQMFLMWSTEISLHSLHHRFTLVFNLQSWGMRLGNPLNFPKKKSPTDTDTQKYSSPPQTDEVAALWHSSTQKLRRGESWVLLTGSRPKVWVQLITWGGVRWIRGAGFVDCPPRAARWVKPWSEQPEELRLMGAMWDDVTSFSHPSSRGQHVSEPCDRHRARHRH